MNAVTRNRLMPVVMAAVLLASGSAVAQTGRLELNVPSFDLFTPTDWIDAATFTLKESIPSGISGGIYLSAPGPVYLEGMVTKKTSNDPAPVLLASFFVTKSKPIQVTQPSGNEFSYNLSIGSLSRGSSIDVTYRENTREVDKLKDQIKTGIAAITGKFAVTVNLRTLDPQTGPILDTWSYTFDIPFASADQAKIFIQIDPVVTTPTPTITVQVPAERPNMEYELAVYRVQDNPRDAVTNGSPLWRERVKDGRTVLIYPPTATPLTKGSRYVIAGTSFIQSSASQEKVGVPSDLVEFRFDDPSSTTSTTGGGASAPGENPTRPDPIVNIFGSASGQIPSALANRLTPILRRLESRGWTLTQFRYNNRTITQAELLNLLQQFADATVTVEE